MWIDGGFSPHSRWLEFRADGTAHVVGMFDLDPGRYRANVDYRKVERFLGDAGVCTRDAPAPGRPPGMDMFSYKVLVQCTDRTRYFTTFAGGAVTPEMVSVRDVIAGLTTIGAQLAWEPSAETGPAPRAPDPPPAIRRLPAATPPPAAVAELHEGTPAPLAAPMPLAVVVRQDGGFAGVHRWLWYDADGTARAHSMDFTGPGTFRARAELALIKQIVDDMGLCERPTSEFRPAGPIGNDMMYSKLSVRCPHQWRTFTWTDVSSGGPSVRDAFRSFQRLGLTLKWAPTDERITLPDAGTLYHTAGTPAR